MHALAVRHTISSFVCFKLIGIYKLFSKNLEEKFRGRLLSFPSAFHLHRICKELIMEFTFIFFCTSKSPFFTS